MGWWGQVNPLLNQLPISVWIRVFISCCVVLGVLMGRIECAFAYFVRQNTTSCIIPVEIDNVKFDGIGMRGVPIRWKNFK